MEQIVSLYVCNMLSIVGWNVWSESNGRHLINPPGEREHHFYSGDGSDNGTDVFPSRLRVTAYFQVLWLAVRERCYSCVWVFVFAARSPTKIVRNTESAMIAKHRSYRRPISPCPSDSIKGKGKESTSFIREAYFRICSHASSTRRQIPCANRNGENPRSVAAIKTGGFSLRPR